MRPINPPEAPPPAGHEWVALPSGDYGWRYMLETTARLLRDIDSNKKLCIGGEHYPNGLNCEEAAQDIDALLLCQRSAVTGSVDAGIIKEAIAQLRASGQVKPAELHELADKLERAVSMK